MSFNVFTWFARLAEREGTTELPHNGRKKLMAAAMRNWNRVCQRCPEETTQLAKRIEGLF